MSETPPAAERKPELAITERTDRANGGFEIVWSAPIEEPARTKAPRHSAFAEPSARPASQEPQAKGPRAPTRRRRHLPNRMRRLLPLLLHELSELDRYEERPMRYGDERATLVLPKIRLDPRRRAPSQRGQGLAAHADLKRVLPRLTSFDTNDASRTRTYRFEGARPDSLHVLSRVLDSSYRFRLEDLCRYAAHGDLVLRALDRLDVSTQAFDLDATLYCPAIDSEYPFKFLLCGETKVDNFVTYMTGLRRIFDRVESVSELRDRSMGEIELGFEKFGPACATPEFQEVELRLFKLLSEIGTKIGIATADIVLSQQVRGEAIRRCLAALHALNAALSACEHLPGELAAHYRAHFDLPFGLLFEHALSAIDAIAAKVSANLTDARPKQVDALAELVSTIRRIPPRSPLENLHARDGAIAAALAGREPPPAGQSPPWVRRYRENIFVGTDRYDIRRFKKAEEDAAAKEKPGGSEEEWSLELDEP